VSHPRLAVFARKAKGQVAPLRVIEGQQTALSRSSHGVFLDALNNEIVAPSPLAAAVVVYGREQLGNTPPIRKIRRASRWTTPTMSWWCPMMDA